MKSGFKVLFGFILIALGFTAHLACLSYTWNSLASTVGLATIGMKGALMAEALSWTIFPVQQSDYLEDPESLSRALVRRLFISAGAAGVAWLSCLIP